MRKLFSILLIATVVLSISKTTLAQETDRSWGTITTATPFLMIGPDARSGGMGDVGGATSPDGNSIYWNASKLAFVENSVGFNVSYVPWLKGLVDDIGLGYVSGYGDYSGYGDNPTSKAKKSVTLKLDLMHMNIQHPDALIYGSIELIKEYKRVVVFTKKFNGAPLAELHNILNKLGDHKAGIKYRIGLKNLKFVEGVPDDKPVNDYYIAPKSANVSVTIDGIYSNSSVFKLTGDTKIIFKLVKK